MTNQKDMDVKRPLQQLKPIAIPRIAQSDGWAKQASKRMLRNYIVPFLDWILKLTAMLFIVATSLKYVVEWLHTNRLNHDFSLAGGILVVSVAIYLIVRKR
jgi:hypothetical protein